MNWAALLSTSLSVHQDSCCCCSVAFSSSNLIQHVQHGGSESPGGVGAERFHVMRPEEPNSVTHGRGRRPRLDRTAKFAPLLIPAYCSCWHLWKDWVLQYTDRFTNQLFLCKCFVLLWFRTTQDHMCSVCPSTDRPILSSLQFNFSKFKFPQFDSCVSSQPRCRQQQLTVNILFCLKNLL